MRKLFKNEMSEVSGGTTSVTYSKGGEIFVSFNEENDSFSLNTAPNTTGPQISIHNRGIVMNDPTDFTAGYNFGESFIKVIYCGVTILKTIDGNGTSYRITR